MNNSMEENFDERYKKFKSWKDGERIALKGEELAKLKQEMIPEILGWFLFIGGFAFGVTAFILRIIEITFRSQGMFSDILYLVVSLGIGIGIALTFISILFKDSSYWLGPKFKWHRRIYMYDESNNSFLAECGKEYTLEAPISGDLLAIDAEGNEYKFNLIIDDATGDRLVDIYCGELAIHMSPRTVSSVYRSSKDYLNQKV